MDLSVSSCGSCPLRPNNEGNALRYKLILSVSSCGSCPLRQGADQGVRSASRNFQYPRADRAHCDSSASINPPIGWFFQYPRADRAHCDDEFVISYADSYGLSVSSCGSCPLRPTRCRQGWVGCLVGLARQGPFFGIVARRFSTFPCR